MMDDPTVALALNLSRYRENFVFESVEDVDSQRVTVIESSTMVTENEQ